MATHTSLASLFSDIADKIRQVGGGSAPIVADTFPDAIENISGGSWLPSASTILATFSRRQSGGQGPATIEKIYGRSIVWNQLFLGNQASYTNSGLTISATNGVYTISGTASANAGFALVPRINTIAGHKYFVRVAGTHNFDSLTWRDVSLATPHDFIYTETTNSSNVALTIGISNGESYSASLTYFVVDLTLATLDEITTPEQFTALYHLPYYAYDPGSLKSLAPDALVTRGINQWDEEWEGGTINSSTGQNQAFSGRMRSTNYIKVFPNTQYYFKKPAGVVQRQYYYGADLSFLGEKDLYATAGTGGTFTTPADVYYIRFMLAQATYGNDVCVNISAPAINGQYFPYRYSRAGINLTNFPYGLNGRNGKYDTHTPTKDTRLWGKVDLGTLNWTYNSSLNIFLVTAAQVVNGANIDCLCAKYPVGSYLDPDTDKIIAMESNGKIRVRDNSFGGDAAAFTTAMSGVNLIYLLATPVETDIDEQMTYLPDLGGTEEVTPITAPFTADIRYAKEI